MQVVSSVQKYVSRAVLSALTSLLAKHPNPTVEELLSPFLKSPSVSECQQRLHVQYVYRQYIVHDRLLFWSKLHVCVSLYLLVYMSFLENWRHYCLHTDNWACALTTHACHHIHT